MNAYDKIRAALEMARQLIPEYCGIRTQYDDAFAALAELERAAAEPACIVESARIEGPTICRRLMWMREVGAGEKLYTTPPPVPVDEMREVVVTDEMAQRVANSFYGMDTFANKSEMRDALRLWRKELGPALGLVEIREPTPEECERIAVGAQSVINRMDSGRAIVELVRAVMWPKSEGL